MRGEVREGDTEKKGMRFMRHYGVSFHFTDAEKYHQGIIELVSSKREKNL